MFEEIEEQLKVTADRVAHLRKFLDVPKSQNRLTEIEGEMSQDNFWDNRNYAQKLVDESSAIKRRIEPLLKAESQQLEQHVRDTTQSVEQEIQALGTEASESIQGASSITDSPPSPPKADANESGDTASKTA